MKKHNVKIALTGGIGSGKSTALSLLEKAGFKTLSSDKIVWELYKKRRVKKKLKSLFPDAVTGIFRLKIDKKKISDKAFSDAALHKKLTDTITPLVMSEILRVSKKIVGTVFVEVPLLFECGYEKYFDDVIVIARSLAERIESVKSRSKLTEKEILARIKNQFDYDSADLSPYIVINNDGSTEDLNEKLSAALKNLKSER